MDSQAQDFDRRGTTKIQRGIDAWQRIKDREKITWKDWLTIGEALTYARNTLMNKHGFNIDNGKRWASLWGPWLKATGFDQIDKATRSTLLKCIEHRARIDRWRNKLKESERVQLNHPKTIWRKFSPAKPRQQGVLGSRQREEIIRLQDEVDSLRAHLRHSQGWNDDPAEFAALAIRHSARDARALAEAILATLDNQGPQPTINLGELGL